ncbi:2-hydroxymuconate tautomerase family protein [Candidatus Woesearchaeota archaeon]|nr:2-hydroxymuconate tautomerase family protein [Candidatus Woesearchaeota archaeon]
MPIVTIEMWEGRDKELKRKLIQNVTKAVSETLGIAEDHTQAIIHEVPTDNWGIRGEQASRMKF